MNVFLLAPDNSSFAAGEISGTPGDCPVVSGWMTSVLKRSLIERPLEIKVWKTSIESEDSVRNILPHPALQ